MKLHGLKINFITASETDNESIKFTLEPSNAEEMRSILTRLNKLIDDGKVNGMQIMDFRYPGRAILTNIVNQAFEGSYLEWIPGELKDAAESVDETVNATMNFVNKAVESVYSAVNNPMAYWGNEFNNWSKLLEKDETGSGLEESYQEDKQEFHIMYKNIIEIDGKDKSDEKIELGDKDVTRGTFNINDAGLQFEKVELKNETTIKYLDPFDKTEFFMYEIMSNNCGGWITNVDNIQNIIPSESNIMTMYFCWVYNDYLWVLDAAMSYKSEDEYLLFLDCGEAFNEEDKKNIKVGILPLAGSTLTGYSLKALAVDAENGQYDTTKESIAYRLKSNIAKWYIALRKIAIVGLLSVLLYIGIQIVLKSTSAENKARYKNMLKDWLVALCLLFVLHYFMAFMTEFIDILDDMVSTNVVKKDEIGNYDELFSTVRSEYEATTDEKLNEGLNAEGVSLVYVTFGYTVIYLALVILTLIFTIQYLKRVIYMAFLTMIAPMICLTYPLDKIKDAKAQAFSYWIREYSFTCLIRVIHLMLYVIFISNTLDFAQENPIYAIVILSFLIPAEKIIKEMFGMKSQSSMNVLGAAAGGAIIMNFANKLKGLNLNKKTGNSGSEDSNNSGRVRTVSRSSNNENTNKLEQKNPELRESAPVVSNQKGHVSENSVLGVLNIRSYVSDDSSEKLPDSNSSGENSSKTGILQGVGRSSNGLNGTGKKSIYGPSISKSNFGKLTRTVGGVVGGAIGGTLMGTLGVAAGVSSGELDKTIQYGGAGVFAGYHGGKNISEKIIHDTMQGVESLPLRAMNIRDADRQGALTEKKYNNKLFDSEEYKAIEQDVILNKMYGGSAEIKVATQQFLDNGVTDLSLIRSALHANISGNEYKKFINNGVDDIDDMKFLLNEGINGKTYEQISNMGIKDINEIKILDQYVPKGKSEFINFITKIKIDGRKVSREEAEEMYIKLISKI